MIQGRCEVKQEEKKEKKNRKPEKTKRQKRRELANCAEKVCEWVVVAAEEE